MNTQSEFDFLKDQVQRLNTALAFYHNLYKQDHHAEISTDVAPLLMTGECPPLLEEYDRIIQTLQHQIRAFKNEIDNEKSKLRAIVKENERLWKENNEIKLSTTSPKRAVENDTEFAYGNLQKQVDLFRKENGNLTELLNITEIELHRLQTQIDEMNSRPQNVIFGEQMESLKHNFRNIIADKDNEIVCLKDINRNFASDLEKVSSKFTELENENKMLSEKVHFQKETGEENLSQLKTSLRRIELLEDDRKQLLNQIDTLNATLQAQDSTKNEWTLALANLESRCREKEQHLYEAGQKITDAQQTVEAVQSEMRNTEIREKQLSAECERLRGVISGILDDAGVRTREEIDSVKAGYDKEVERLLEELDFCEQNRQQLLAEVDQLKRSKSQLEKELEALYRSEKERAIQDNNSTESLHERAIRAERERENLRLEMKSAENGFEKERLDWLKLRELLENDNAQNQTRLVQLQTSCDKLQLDADRFAKLLSASEDSSKENQKKFHESLRKCRHDYEILKQSSIIRQMELEAKLESSEQTQRTISDEMRQLLAKQQQVNERWREEAHTIASQYEDRVNQLTKEMERYQKRHSEQVALLQESKQKLLENQELIEDKNKVIEQLNNRLHILDDESKPYYDHDTPSQDDSSWQLKQIKKQQQKLIRESVARSTARQMQAI